jgi:hypothetical protein
MMSPFHSTVESCPMPFFNQMVRFYSLTEQGSLYIHDSILLLILKTDLVEQVQHVLDVLNKEALQRIVLCMIRMLQVEKDGLSWLHPPSNAYIIQLQFFLKMEGRLYAEILNLYEFY